MNFALNSMAIDTVIVFILLLMLIFGYFKGFVYRVYDLMATVVSLLAALYASSPLSAIYQIYKVEGIGEIVGKTINRFIIFIILFIALKVILLIIGKFIKPILKNIIYTISIFEHLDHLLGALVSLIEGTIIIYLALIFVITPIIPGGKENVEKTVVASKILELVPSVTEEMKALSDGFDVFTNIINDGINYDSFDARNVAALAASLNSAYKHGLINQEDLESALIKYYDEIDRVNEPISLNQDQYNEPISLNQDQYNEVVDVLSKLDSAKFDQTKILNKIIVSE